MERLGGFGEMIKSTKSLKSQISNRKKGTLSIIRTRIFAAVKNQRGDPEFIFC